MIRVFTIALLLLAVVVRLPAESHPIRRNFLLNRDIVALAQAGFDEQTIINTMLVKPNRFDTSLAALRELASQGISERIVQVMLVAKNSKPASVFERGALLLPGRVTATYGPQALGFVQRELPMAGRGVPYNAPIETQVDGRCPNGNATMSIASGALPHGVELTMLRLEGTPRETGRFHFTIRAMNNCAVVSRAFELVVMGKPILETGPDQVSFSCQTPAHAAAQRTILVSSTWPSLPYTVETKNAPWLRAAQENGVTPDADSALTGDVVTLTADPAGLKPGTYRGSVVFRTRYGANAPSVAVVLLVGDAH